MGLETYIVAGGFVIGVVVVLIVKFVLDGKDERNSQGYRLEGRAEEKKGKKKNRRR